jgi:4-oxalocrotonate tautomerase
VPIVRVELFTGRSVDQKRELVRGITDVVARTCGVSAEGVHVLIKEMSRENWGRGAILNADRPRATAAAPHTPVLEFVAVSIGGADVESEQDAPERLGRLASRSTDGGDDLAFSSWSSEQAWKAGGGAPDATLCDRVDLPAGGGLRGTPHLDRYMTVSTHEVEPTKLEEYLELRRIAVNPGMARLHGFVSSDILCKRAAPNAFFVVNQWLTKQDSEAYSEGPLHAYLKSRVRPLLISHSGMREYAVRTAREGSIPKTG